MGRYTIRQVYLRKRLTAHLELDSYIPTVGLTCDTYRSTSLYRVKRRVQWSPLEEPKYLGSEVDFAICIAYHAAAPLHRDRDHPPSLHLHKTTKDGPALQGDWGCASLASRLGIRSDTGPDIEHHYCVLRRHTEGRRIAKFQLLPVPW